MMESSIEDLERLRLELVSNVAKLHGLVKHWRIQETEYEGLKEGLAELPEDASADEIRDAARDCAGDLLTDKEIKSIIEDKTRIRTPRQIISLVDRRIDYVQQNITSIEKRLDNEERKLDEANFLGHRDEEGLPIMDITEQLDENGNVISSSVVKPGDTAPNLLDIFRKGGIQDLESNDKVRGEQKLEMENSGAAGKDLSESSGRNFPLASRPKKGVKFADDLQIHEIQESEPSPARKVRFAEAVDVGQEQPITDPVIPENESAEETALRREMLEYNMRKIGTIVAEIDIDEEGDSDSDYDDEEDDEDEDEEEDEHGRSTMQVISEDYREKMLALEKKLNAKAIINMGPDAKVIEKKKEVISSPTIPQGNTEKDTKASKSRGVRFAETLDTQDGPKEMRATNDRTNAKGETVVEALKDQIVERVPIERSNAVPPRKKISRFMASRMTTAEADKGNDLEGENVRKATQRQPLYPEIDQNTNGTGEYSKATPAGTINPTVIERAIDDTTTDVREPDSLDGEIHAAEIRNAYHDARNKFIQRENGFMNQDMEEYEDEHGRPLISRFKAARLAAQKVDDAGPGS